MDTVEALRTVRLLQVIALMLGGCGSIVFLWRYRHIWDLYDEFARFVILLNATFALVTLTVALPRILGLPHTLWWETLKLVLYSSLAVVLGYQLILMRRPEMPHPFDEEEIRKLYKKRE